jgi:spore germination protein KB
LYGIVVVLVAAYAVFSGLEVIARINEILLPIGLIILIFIAVINIPYLDLTKLLPILYDGFAPSLKGTLFIQTWMLEIVVFLQILPYIKNKKKIRISMNISIGFLGISLQVGVMTIAVFGVALTGKLLFPALDYVRYAKLGHYIQNLDISIMIVWISGIFIKIAFSYFAGTLALAQLFGLKSYRKIIIPVGIIIVVFSTVTGRTLTDILFVLKYILPFYFLFMAMVLPCLLLLVSFLREGKKS